jgi:hypothetical protein
VFVPVCAFGWNQTLPSCAKQPCGHSVPTVSDLRQMKAPPPSLGAGTFVPVVCRFIWEKTLEVWMKQPCLQSVPTSELYGKVVTIAMLPELLHSATLAMAVGPFAHWFAVRP